MDISRAGYLPIHCCPRDSDRRAGIYDAMNDALARLHNFDWAGNSLGDFGKPAQCVARQITRWRKQYVAASTR